MENEIQKDNDYYIRDIEETEKLNKRFIENYNKLNKMFAFMNPIEISTMFNYLLYKGYLSINKQFEYPEENMKDITTIYSLYGTHIILGKATCRHIATMHTDILNDYKIETNNLCVYRYNYTIKVLYLTHQKYTKEELMNWAKINVYGIGEDVYNEVIKRIEKLVDEEKRNVKLTLKKAESILQRIRDRHGNHLISFAYQNGIGYFLDPTNNEILRMSEKNRNVLYHANIRRALIKLACSEYLNEDDTYQKMKERLEGSVLGIPIEEEKMLIAKTINICDNNLDIFERFYSENSDLYNEIASKVLKISRLK